MKSIRDQIDAITAEWRSIVATETFHGVESDLVSRFVSVIECGHFDERLPLSQHDTIVLEMALKYGRADIVIFHVDGSASVIEAKNGSHGYNHVVCSIGQASLYASQLAMTKGSVTKVRKCLLWSSTGNLLLDGAIEDACECANTIALPWPTMSKVMAVQEAVSRVAGRSE